MFTLAASNVNHSEVISLFTYFICNHLGETMPMLPYPPYTKPSAAEKSLLRVLGGILALLAILLALLGIIIHQGVSDLIFAIIVGMFALRVFLLWLGDKPQHKQVNPRWSSTNWVRYPMQSPPYTAGQPAPYAQLDFQSQPLYQLAPEEPGQQTESTPPAVPSAPLPGFPHSIRLQRPPKAAAFPDHPVPPPQEVQPMPYASVSIPLSAPLPMLSQQESWQYDDEIDIAQQRGNDHDTA
jgi:hypothetical protein